MGPGTPWASSTWARDGWVLLDGERNPLSLASHLSRLVDGIAVHAGADGREGDDLEGMLVGQSQAVPGRQSDKYQARRVDMKVKGHVWVLLYLW